MSVLKLFNRKALGDNAEHKAEQHLIGLGLKLVTRNYRTRFGEVDLIMQDGETLVFIEVRFRKSESFGGALASIGSAKQKRLIAAAEQYLTQFRRPPPCRFDAVLLTTGANESAASTVEWLKDAFSA